MNDPQHERLTEVFLAAADLPPQDRPGYLDTACGSDADLRQAVEALLQQDGNSSPIRTRGLVERWGDTLSETPRINGYRILECLGEGGMGTVYRAEQQRPQRMVAIKVLRRGRRSERMLRRFEDEAQILARLEHAGIARIYETRTIDTPDGPQPFLAMELVDGVPLTEHATQAELSLDARIRLLARVCDAVHYAHQRGIIHRDLKPANILVDAGGQPRIVDFGIARMTAEHAPEREQTAAAELLGTLPYMSPEQVDDRFGNIDVRTDVYALGVIAYELLGGQLPYAQEGASLTQMVEQIRAHTPRPLGQLEPGLQGDLEAVVGHALAKLPEERYESAAALGLDLRRVLEHQPILARPPGTWHALKLFARRKRALVLASLLAFGMLLLAIVGTTYGLIRARRGESLAEQRLVAMTVAQQAAELRRQQAEAVSAFLGSMLRAPQPAQSGKDATILEALDAAEASLGDTLADQPAMQATVYAELGMTYAALGASDKGIDYLRRAQRLRIDTLGPDDPRTAELESALALALLKSDFDNPEVLGEAESLLQHARDVLTSNTEARLSDQLLECWNNLALVYWQRRAYPRAQTLTEELLTLCQREYGDDDDRTLQQLENLAMLAGVGGQLEKKADTLEQIVATRIARHGPESPATWASQRNYGGALLAVGRADDALQVYDRMIPVLERELGPQHAEVLGLRHHQGMSLYLLRRYDDAEQSLRATIAAETEALGERNALTLHTTALLTDLLFRAERYEELQPLADSLSERTHAIHGYEAPVARQRRIWQSAARWANEQSPEACEQMNTLWTERDRLPDQHTSQLLVACGQAMCLQDRTEAERILREALELARSLHGDDHVNTDLVRQRLERLATETE